MAVVVVAVVVVTVTVVCVVVVVAVVVVDLQTVSIPCTESQAVCTSYPEPHAVHCWQHLALSGFVLGLQPTSVPTRAHGRVLCAVSYSQPVGHVTAPAVLRGPSLLPHVAKGLGTSSAMQFKPAQMRAEDEGYDTHAPTHINTGCASLYEPRTKHLLTRQPPANHQADSREEVWGRALTVVEECLSRGTYPVHRNLGC